MKIRKKPLTLLEIMIVIFLIGLIGSVIGYNMKGSLEEGKAFKTEQAMGQIKDILLLEIAKGRSRDEVIEHAENYLKRSGIVKNVSNMLKDGWGEKFQILASRDSDIKVVSEKYEKFKQKKNKNTGRTVEEVEEQENEDREEA